MSNVDVANPMAARNSLLVAAETALRGGAVCKIIFFLLYSFFLLLSRSLTRRFLISHWLRAHAASAIEGQIGELSRAQRQGSALTPQEK